MSESGLFVTISFSRSDKSNVSISFERLHSSYRRRSLVSYFVVFLFLSLSNFILFVHIYTLCFDCLRASFSMCSVLSLSLDFFDFLLEREKLHFHSLLNIDLVTAFYDSKEIPFYYFACNFIKMLQKKRQNRTKNEQCSKCKQRFSHEVNSSSQHASLFSSYRMYEQI